jgi:DNA repair protein RadC
VFKAALLANAAAIIVVHNHPSGDPTPTVDDIEVTRRLAATGQVVGIEVLDHIVVGLQEYRQGRFRIAPTNPPRTP